MSSTIDYFEKLIVCPHCGFKWTVDVSREQDNRTGQTYFSPETVTCPECDETFDAQ